MEDPYRPGLLQLERPTLVLNRSWIPVHVTAARRAICLVFRENARIIAADLQTYDFASWALADHVKPSSMNWVSSGSLCFPLPEVIQLVSYNKVRGFEAPFSRRNLFMRDRLTCQYCGKRRPYDQLSIDHIQPRSKGGGTSWYNCVLACVSCNSSKGNRSLRECGLRLIRKPKPPRWTPYLNLAQSDWLKSWEPFTKHLPKRSATGT